MYAYLDYDISIPPYEKMLFFVVVDYGKDNNKLYDKKIVGGWYLWMGRSGATSLLGSM